MRGAADAGRHHACRKTPLRSIAFDIIRAGRQMIRLARRRSAASKARKPLSALAHVGRVAFPRARRAAAACDSSSVNAPTSTMGPPSELPNLASLDLTTHRLRRGFQPCGISTWHPSRLAPPGMAEGEALGPTPLIKRRRRDALATALSSNPAPRPQADHSGRDRTARTAAVDVRLCAGPCGVLPPGSDDRKAFATGHAR